MSNNRNYTLMDAKKAEEIVRSNVKKRRRNLFKYQQINFLKKRKTKTLI